MGRTVERGYGGRHKKLRRYWVYRLQAGDTVICPRCGLLIESWMEFDLGHDDHDRSLQAQPEHQRCNRAASARRVNAGYRRTTPAQRAAEWAAKEDAYWAQVELERRAQRPPRPAIH